MNEEVTGGMTAPLIADEMRGIMQRFLPKVHEAEERAPELRRRVADGDYKLSRIHGMLQQGIPTNITPELLKEREAVLDALKEELRYYDAWECIGRGMGIGWAAAAVAGEGMSWPQGSLVRVWAPGLLDVTVDLCDSNFQSEQPR